MRYYIIAGEASGDLHGAKLVKSIKEKDATAICRAWGGDLMEAEGVDLVKHYRDLAFMGFVEVVKNLRTILGNISFCKKDILAFKPDALVLIDYPGFNLRIAKWAKARNIKVFYYISPQIWAWHTSRVHDIKKHIERMFVILPFEKDFYKKFDYDVEYVGHPLADTAKNHQPHPDFKTKNQLGQKPIIALLPGSRKQEIRRMLHVMLEMTNDFPNHQFVIAGAPSIPLSYYQEILKDKHLSTVSIIENQTYDLLSLSEAALVTSGTATLETALFKVPQIVCYYGNSWSYYLARKLIKVKYISLVNLIMDRPLIKELIQSEFNRENLKTELSKILTGPERIAMIEGYEMLHGKLGSGGGAERVAQGVIENISKKLV